MGGSNLEFQACGHKPLWNPLRASADNSSKIDRLTNFLRLTPPLGPYRNLPVLSTVRSGHPESILGRT